MRFLLYSPKNPKTTIRLSRMIRVDKLIVKERHDTKLHCLLTQRHSVTVLRVLTLKAPNKNCSRQHFNFSLLSFNENKA